MEKILFLDTETTGLAKNLPNEKILELGLVAVSVPDFEEVAWMSDVVRTTRLDLMKMHPEVQTMHAHSGLWKEVEFGGVSVRALEERAIVFVLQNGLQGSVCCGANPDFDRRFLEVHMPELNDLLHYRNFDTNSFWLYREMLTGGAPARDKGATHRAVDDCRAALATVKGHFDFMAELLGVAELNTRIERLLAGN